MLTSQPIDLATILQEAFPRNLLRNLAFDCKLVQRLRVFDPVLFFWALVSTVLAHWCKSIAAVQAEYEFLAQEPIDRASFYRHVDGGAVRFLHTLLAHAMDHFFPETTSPPLLRAFAQTLIQDSTIFRVRNKLAGKWPGVSTQAGVKLNVVLCANNGRAHRVAVTKGTRSETKLTAINASLADSLLIFDLGYQCLRNFARIENHGGYFLTRLKESMQPKILESHLVARGNAIPVEGKKLRDVLPYLRRDVLDVAVEMAVNLKGQPGPVPLDGHRPEIRVWRVVGLRNKDSGEYHLYLTNIPPDWLTAEEVGVAYGYRWEIERLFAEFKGPYDLGTWAVEREEAMLCQTYAVLIAWVISRRLRAAVIPKKDLPDALKANLAAPTLRWARKLAHHIRDLVVCVLEERRAPRHLCRLLRAQVRDPNRARIPLAARVSRGDRSARLMPAPS